MILFYYKVGGQYEGKNPNNYIWFNNELWRIIGVFDESSHGQSGQNLVKIIRNESIGGLVWDKSSTNDWSTSSLKILLNENYYNATDGRLVVIAMGIQQVYQVIAITLEPE